MTPRLRAVTSSLVVTCAAVPAAYARSDLGCEEQCADDGRCRRVDDECVVLFDDDCRRSHECRVHGLCNARVPDLDYEKGLCVAASTIDCQKSEFCAWSKDCFLNREKEVCDDGKELNSREALVAGFVALALGGVAGIAGGAMSLRDAFNSNTCDADFCPRHAFFVSGGVLILGGTTMAAAGGVKVRREPWELGATLSWQF